MNKRPGQVDVITEVGYCPSCGRTRNLRREEHHLGALVRTIVTCETCHRTLSSSVGVASPEPVHSETQPMPTAAPVEAPAAQPPARKPPAKAAPAQTKVAAKRAPAKKPAATKPSAKKAAVKKPAATKPATRGKPTSTATRKTTRRK
jgi:hypothetical protein